MRSVFQVFRGGVALGLRVVGLALCATALVGAASAALYTEGPGSNPPFEAIRDSLGPGGHDGTTIDVNNAAVEGGAYGDLPIESPILLHTLPTSATTNLGVWSRWYQEDGATQVFRLFEGEENVRNDRPLAARVEAFSREVEWNARQREWHDWVARITVVDPIDAAIFQAKDQDAEAWSVHLNMDSGGSVYATHRRPKSGQPKRVTLIENAVGQPFDVRVRDNGLDYEVYLNNAADPITTGTFLRNSEPGDTSMTRFRWGLYVGASEVERDGMIFFSHATIDPPKRYLVGDPGQMLGDFNGDGRVDAADYTLFRDRDSRADVNGDRRLDEVDYAAWVADYGNVRGGPGGAAPEPASASTSLLAMIACATLRMRRV